jgi:intracellular sulfur oxidation DsrE/DsrF family protein
VSQSNRRAFLAASVIGAALTTIEAMPVAAAASTAFDRAAFEARIRAPFRHRQAFAAPRVANGAVLGFMLNSLNAYEYGFGEGPGTLHAAAVFYSIGVTMAMDDEAWNTFHLSDLTVRSGDAVPDHAGNGNPFGRRFVELQQRNASFFVCSNALRDLAGRAGTTIDVLITHLLPGMMLVPAGVAAINALQEERFTLFQTTS